VTPESVATIAASSATVTTVIATGIVKSLKAFGRLERALAVVDNRSKQLETNGGSSLFDGFRRLETKVDRMGDDVVLVRERLAVVEKVADQAAHDVSNVRASVDRLAVHLPRRSNDTST
jgi:hypothetical protein